MNLELNVTCSTRIKRKKPWPQLTWIGKQKEELLLMDRNRLSYLHLPSGQTTRKIGCIHSHLHGAVQLVLSTDGFHVGALLTSGDILLWEKDTNIISKVPGLPEFSLEGSVVPLLFIGPNSKQIIVVCNKNQAYLWQASKNTEMTAGKYSHILCGSWLPISSEPDVILPSPDNKEAIVTFNYIASSIVSGQTVIIVYISSVNDSICMTVCYLTQSAVLALVGSKDSSVTVVWKQITLVDKYFDPDFLILKKKGAYVASISNSGSLLVLAANQYASDLTQLVFVSLSMVAIHKVDLNNFGKTKKVISQNRQNWLCDLCWTHDDCFVLGITRDGSVVMTTRLGQTLLFLSLQGCHMDKEPALLLNIYPLSQPPVGKSASVLTVQTDDPDAEEESATSSLCFSEHTKTMRQRFSVSAHKNSSHVVVSDGYQVTLLDFPSNMSGLLPTAHSYLAQAQHALRLVTSQTLPIKSPSHYRSRISVTSAHEHRGTLQQATTSEGRRKCSGYGQLSTLPRADNADCWEQFHLVQGLNGLTDAWALLASNALLWTAQMDHTCQQIILLLCRALHTSICTSFTLTQEFFSSLHHCYDILRFDTVHRHLLPSSLKLLNLCVETAAMSIHELVTAFERLQLLQFLYTLIETAEVNVTDCYVSVPKNVAKDEISFVDGSFCHEDAIENSIIPTTLITKRGKKAWSELYREVVSMHKALTSCPGSKGDLLDMCEDLLSRVQFAIQAKGWNLYTFLPKIEAKSGRSKTAHFLSGYTSEACQMWIKDLTEKPSQQSSKKLHRILYAFFYLGKLKPALLFVSGILSGNLTGVTGDRDSTYMVVQVAKALNSKAVQSLLVSFASVFVAYYSKNLLYVYPVHFPIEMTTTQTGFRTHRGIFLLPAALSWQLSSQGLDCLLTPSFVLECLVLSGQWAQAMSFALSLGHWRQAWGLSALCWMTNNLFKNRQKMTCPTEILLPELKILLGIQENIEPENVYGLENYDQQLQDTDCIQSLRDGLLASLLFCPDFDPLPTLLRALVQKIISLVTAAPLLVPQEMYLPTPPLFCPPQSIGYEEGDIPGRESEEGFRLGISSLLQKATCLLQAAYLSIPLLAWYTNFLKFVWQEMGQDLASSSSFSSLTELCRSCSDLTGDPDQLNPSHWHIPEDNGALECLQYVRDLCGLLWFLSCRDHLSMAVRQLQEFTLTSSLISGRKDPHSTQHLHVCYQVLHYAEFLLPFQKYLSSRDSLIILFLNVALELPPTQDLIELVAQLMLSIDIPSKNVETKHSELIELWKSEQCDIFSTISGKKHSKKARFQKISKGNSVNVTGQTWDVIYDKVFNEQKQELELKTAKYNDAVSVFSTSKFLCSNYQQFSYELEVFFIELLVPYFQVGVLKYQAIEPAPPQIPLLKAFTDTLRKLHISCYEDSVKCLQKQENVEARRISIIDLTYSCHELQEKDFGFSSKVKRRSVLYRQKTKIFCSPSKKAVDKFEKLVMQIRKQKNKRKTMAAAKKRWRSLSSLASGQGSTDYACKNSSTLNLFSPQKTCQSRPNAAQEVSLLSEVLKEKIGEDFVCFYTWLQLWLTKNTSDMAFKPACILLGFAREAYISDSDLLIGHLKRMSSKSSPKKPQLMSKIKKKTVTFSPKLSVSNKMSTDIVNNASVDSKNSLDVSSVSPICDSHDLEEEATYIESSDEFSVQETEPFACSQVGENDSQLNVSLSEQKHNRGSHKNNITIFSDDKCTETDDRIVKGSPDKLEKTSVPSSPEKILLVSSCKLLLNDGNGKPIVHDHISPESTRFKDVLSVAPKNQNQESEIQRLKETASIEHPSDAKIASILKNLKKSVDFITSATSDTQIGQDTLAPVEVPKLPPRRFSFQVESLDHVSHQLRSNGKIVTRKFSLPQMISKSLYNDQDGVDNKLKPHPESDNWVCESGTELRFPKVHFSKSKCLETESPKYPVSTVQFDKTEFSSLPACSHFTPDYRSNSLRSADTIPEVLTKTFQDSSGKKTDHLSSSTQTETLQKFAHLQHQNNSTDQSPNHRHYFITKSYQPISANSTINEKLLSQIPLLTLHSTNKSNFPSCRKALKPLSSSSITISFPSELETKQGTSAPRPVGPLSLPLLKVDVPRRESERTKTKTVKMLSPEKLSDLVRNHSRDNKSEEVPMDLSSVRNFLNSNKNKSMNTILKPLPLLQAKSTSTDLESKVKRIARDIPESNQPERLVTTKHYSGISDAAENLGPFEVTESEPSASRNPNACNQERDISHSSLPIADISPCQEITHQSTEVNFPTISRSQSYAELQQLVYSRLRETEMTSSGVQTAHHETADVETSTDIVPGRTSSETQTSTVLLNGQQKSAAVQCSEMAINVSEHQQDSDKTLQNEIVVKEKVQSISSLATEILPKKTCQEISEAKGKSIISSEALKTSELLPTTHNNEDSVRLEIESIKAMLTSQNVLNRAEVKRDLSERLQKMQKQLEVIENISSNVQRSFSSTKQVLQNMELSSVLKEDSTSRRLITRSECGKNHEISESSEAYNRSDEQSNWIMKLPIRRDAVGGSTLPRSALNRQERKFSLPEIPWGETQTLQQGRRRISFGRTDTILVPKIDEFEKTFRIVPFAKDASEENAESSRMKSADSALLKVYGRNSLPRQATDDLKVELRNRTNFREHPSFDKDTSNNSDASSDTLSPWEVPDDVQRILYGAK